MFVCECVVFASDVNCIICIVWFVAGLCLYLCCSIGMLLVGLMWVCYAGRTQIGPLVDWDILICIMLLSAYILHCYNYCLYAVKFCMKGSVFFT